MTLMKRSYPSISPNRGDTAVSSSRSSRRTAAAADSLDVRSVVAVRPGLHPQVTSEVETVTLRLSGKTVALPLAARSALDRLLAGPAVRVGDLPIDDASALVIVRRLLREGVLVTATDERIDIDAGPDPTPFVEA